MLSYLVWSPKPYIVDLGFTELRWYGLLFALGFIISQQIMFYIFKKEGKTEKQVEVLTLYMVLATIIGARLGHVLFYEPAKYLSNPIDIFKVWEGGLASHGGAVGIITALYLFSRKYKDINYLWILDRIVIVVAITATLIRTGNFINSEIIGIPTEKPIGIVFGRDVETRVGYLTSAITSVEIEKARSTTDTSEELSAGFEPIVMHVGFDKKNDQALVTSYVESKLLAYLQTDGIKEYVTFDENARIDYLPHTDGIVAKIYGYGIARHPAQLYEAISSLFLFILLFYLWNRNRSGLADGRLFGIFLIGCFGLRFFYEFIKENQVAFEDDIALNMGQWLSIPLVLAGIFFIIKSFRAEKRI